MKNILSILLVSFILLSGMHFSVANHYCGGKVADIKISFSGEKATCGMAEDEQTCPIHDGLSSNCCRNEVSFFAVDNYDSPSSLQIEKILKQIDQLFLIPVHQLSYSTTPTFQVYTNVKPPDYFATNDVSLPKICVFII
ncbi:MAG: hypothetical protein GZ091_14635 [Paludibacter sp.]|nr:hypothetical protein [Paludibacter sp.]